MESLSIENGPGGSISALAPQERVSGKGIGFDRGLGPELGDAASALLLDVATADIQKLSRILNPGQATSDGSVLDVLLSRALAEITNGNPERAVGYVADYATRNPNGAENLPALPELAPIRTQIHSMVSRMTVVAKISAEDQLSRAEQAATRSSGQRSNWETSPSTILKIAQRLFDSGGYANYWRAGELARVVVNGLIVSGATASGHAAQAMVASATANSATFAQPSNTACFVTSDALPNPLSNALRFRRPHRALSTPMEDLIEDLDELRQIAMDAMRLMWDSAPLLLMLVIWFCLGAGCGSIFAVVSRMSLPGTMEAAGKWLFEVWGLGFLALVGFGFYARIRDK